MAIRIITDSAADYSAQENEKRQITCIPMTVSFGDKEFMDGKNITKDEFFKLLTEGKDFPKTSQPSPSNFLECFEEAKEAGDSVIAILVSSALSGTLQNAVLAKSMADYENIFIIDSKIATLGMRILVDRAVKLRDAGRTVQEIVDEVENLRPRLRLFAGLDTLEYLAKGGRLSKTSATLGNLANLKPIITFTAEGNVSLCGKQMGIRHACKQVAKLTMADAPDMDCPIYLLYAYEQKNCAAFLHTLQKSGLNLDSPKVRGIGPIIGTHIGTGAFGIVYVAKETE